MPQQNRGNQKLKLQPFEAGGFAFANCAAFEAADGKHLVALMRTHLGRTRQVHPTDIEACLAAIFDNAGGLTHLLRRGVVHVDFWLAVANATDWTMGAQDLDVGALFAVVAYIIDGRCYAEKAGVQPTGRLARAVAGFLRTIRNEELDHLFPSGSLGPDDKWPDAADSDDEDGGAAAGPSAAEPFTFTVALRASRPVAAAPIAQTIPAAPVASSAAALPSAPDNNNNNTTTATSVVPAAAAPAGTTTPAASTTSATAPTPDAAGKTKSETEIKAGTKTGSTAAPAPFSSPSLRSDPTTSTTAGNPTLPATTTTTSAVATFNLPLRPAKKRSNEDEDEDDENERPAAKLRRTK